MSSFEIDKSHFTIDLDSLDTECIRQPELVFEYSKHAAEMRRLQDIAKTNLEIIEAKVQKWIRKEPLRYLGIEKPTEAAIKSGILTHEKYQSALKELQDAVFNASVASAAVNSLEHKKRSLQNLVELHGQNYFAEPSVTRENREAVTDHAKAKIRKKGQIKA